MTKAYDVGAALSRPGGILHRFRRGRERGFALMEGILYLSLVGSVVVFTAQTLQEEGMRQEESLIADGLNMVQDGSANFVSEYYDDLRAELFDASGAGGDALMTVTMQRLADDDMVPEIFIQGGGIRNTFGQQYALLLRAVDRRDGGAPQATLTRAQLDPSASGTIAPFWVDDDPSNGEMEIESILVSHGGRDIPMNRAGRVLAKSGLQIAGLVKAGDFTEGPFGNFQLPLTPYQTLPEYPEVGRFANLVSLSGFGVLGGEGEGRNLVDMDRALLRCADISPSSDPNAYSACLDNTDNEFMSQLVFRRYADDGGTTVYPGIRGLTNLTCDNSDPTGTVAADALLVDCATTTFDGDVAITSSLTVADGSGSTSGLSATGLQLDGSNVLATTTIGAGAETRLDVDRAMVGGMDVGQYLNDPQIVSAEGEVDIPACGTDENGVALEPAIYTSPAAYADARGRPIVGVRAFAEPGSTASTWKVRMISFVEEDYCEARNGSGQIVPLDPTGLTYPNGAPTHPNCSVFNADGTVAADRSDGKVDIYEIVSGFGKVMAQTRCVAAP